jgi:flavin reductase (DIM6/NTAB) family NADH-FMN oxidoreductase RutF
MEAIGVPVLTGILMAQDRVIGGNMGHRLSRTIQEQPRLVERERFRSVMSRFASGVSIITTRHEGIDYGLTASAVTSLSLDPPMLLICVNKASNTRDALAEAQVFAVNILREDQGELARRFADSQPGKFEGQCISYGELGVPLLDDVLATIECRVSEIVSGGTHSIFLAEVQTAQATEEMPLTYFRGRMGRFIFMGIDARTALWKHMQWEDGA